MTRSLCVVLLTVVAGSLPALAEEGVINLGPEEIIKAKGADIVVPGYAIPCFEDWNKDLLKDLIVGEGGGAVPGKVRVYLNVGTEADPCFADYSYAQAEGKELTVTPQGCLGSHPRMVDWDEDGRKDLLLGLADGTVRIYLNIGDANRPAFDGGADIRVGNDNAFKLDVGLRAAPVAVHWNDDGLLDLVVGGLDGAIHVYYNCGCGGSVPPRFYLSQVEGTFAQNLGQNLLVPSGRSSPVVMDLDGDGKKDLLTGNTDGLVLFYKNTGTASLPAFSGYSPVQSGGLPIDLPGTLRTRPFVCYWTGDGHSGSKDGYWDLLVGYGDGKIRLYRGIPKLGDLDADGALDGDDLTLLAKAMNKPIPPTGSAADLNKDGAVDILDLVLFADLWLAEHGDEKG